MKVTGWNNGSHHVTGAGYGLKVSIRDRNKHFVDSWHTVFVLLPGTKHEIEINIAKDSFWNGTCRELIHKEIGRWLIKHGFAPWPPYKPPKFDLIPIRDRHFELRLIN
jgi:hypothetical protein